MPLPPLRRLRHGWQVLAPDLRPERRSSVLLVALLLLAVGPGVASPLLVQQLFDRALPANDEGLLLAIAAAICGLTILGAGCRYAAALVSVGQRCRVRYRLNRRLLNHLLRLPLPFFHASDSRYLVTRTRDDVAALDSLMPHALLQAAVDGGRGLIFFAMLFVLDAPMALGGLALIALLALGFLATAPLLRRTARDAQEEQARTGTALLDALAGIVTIRTSAREAEEARRVARSLARPEPSRARRDRTGHASLEGLNLAGVVGSYAVLAYGAWRVMEGSSTIGTLFSFFVLLTQLIFATQGVLGNNAEWQRGLAALKRIGELLEEEIETDPLPVRRAVPGHGAVRFEGISVAYAGAPPVLRGVTLEVRPGEVMALVGPSGAGKSTLVSLLPRLVEPRAGRVLLGGRPLDSYSRPDLRRCVGYVTQDVFLFHRTVRENLTFAVPGAGEEEMREAARAAGAEEFILRLPEGYDTRVGERGTRLSGGQRQRIALARELLRDPPVLVLDEATSALDAENEERIRRTLELLRGRRTCLVVAHRLSTVLAADRIAVLDDGRLLDVGRHPDLLERCALYRRLCELQLQPAAARLPPGATPGSPATDSRWAVGD